MAAAQQEWKVRPHGKLTPVDENILTVKGDIHMPIGNIPRRMTVVRLRDGRLVIFSAVSLDEEQMSVLESFGTPAYLIVPNDYHRMDAQAWKARYPTLQVIAPAGARERTEKAVHVDATGADFGDPEVRLITVPGTREHECALEVQGSGGVTLVLNDLVANIRDAHGITGWFLRMMGLAGDEPHIPVTVKAAIVKDKAALRDQLLRWASMQSLRRILVAHGQIIDTNPAGALRELAVSLE